MEKSCGVELGWIIMVFNSILYCVSVCLGGKCNNASLTCSVGDKISNILCNSSRRSLAKAVRRLEHSSTSLIHPYMF